jgi:uncharacterized membrane protein
MLVTRLAPRQFLHESALTRLAVILSALIILNTAGYLLWYYSSLPPELAVHWQANGFPNGFQYKTIPRVLLPVFVQLGLFVTTTAIGTLLLARKDAATSGAEADARAAVTAAEAVVLLAATWIAFQAYAAYALVALWTHYGHTLGRGYTVCEAIGLVLTIAIGIRAQFALSKPEPLPYTASHWRFGELYCNADHPALFVPTRNGRRWTLNFGRRAAVVLLAGILGVGILAPVVMLVLAFR